MDYLCLNRYERNGLYYGDRKNPADRYYVGRV